MEEHLILDHLNVQINNNAQSPTKTGTSTQQEYGFYLNFGNSTILCRR